MNHLTVYASKCSRQSKKENDRRARIVLGDHLLKCLWGHFTFQQVVPEATRALSHWRMMIHGTSARSGDIG